MEALDGLATTIRPSRCGRSVDVRFADLPQIEGATGRFLLQQMVAVAELEAGMISKRIKDALAAAKKRGTKLGGRRRKIIGQDAKGKPIYGDVANGSPAARKASLRARQARADQRARHRADDRGATGSRRSEPEGHCRWSQCPSHSDCPRRAANGRQRRWRACWSDCDQVSRRLCDTKRATMKPGAQGREKAVVMKALLLAVILAGPVAAQPVDASAAPSIAQDEHGHGGLRMHRGGGRNSAYGKAKVEERDRLLSKLRNTNICRGC
jgi:hypothetical protein